MKSSVINPAPHQLVLDFEPGLVERYRSARDCVAAGVYQRGLKRIAMDLEMAPGNLSVQLSDDTARHFSLDAFERYLTQTGDMTPLHFLIEKYLADRSRKKEAALEQIQSLAPQLITLLKQAGARA